jgi:hypothetical protein
METVRRATGKKGQISHQIHPKPIPGSCGFRKKYSEQNFVEFYGFQDKELIRDKLRVEM